MTIEAMTDDEVRAWLSNEERGGWTGCGRAIGDCECCAETRGYLRSLAETRKALADTEWQGGGYEGDPHCFFCCADREPSYKHAPDCIFTTMPRPLP